jgi:ankyrin repeat protein
LIKALIDKGVDVKIKDVCGRTPLHTAANWDDLETVKLLLKKGALVDAKMRDGKTPFYKAICGCSKKVVEFLFDKYIEENNYTELHAKFDGSMTLLDACVERKLLPESCKQKVLEKNKSFFV